MTTDLSMFRSIIEALSRDRVLRRRLPADLGHDRIYVTPDSMLRYWRYNMRKVEPELFDLLPRIVKPGDSVWDIGANVGIFTFAAAHFAGSGLSDTADRPRGRVLAVEPDAWLVQLMRRSVAKRSSRGSDIEVLPAAISNRIGAVRFNIARRGRAASHLAGLGRAQAGGSRDTVTVLSVTLDWLMSEFGQPQVVKIDVEGAEALALEGGTKLLRDARPVVVCEVGREVVDWVFELFNACEYNVTDLESGGVLSKTSSRSFGNVLALPR